VERVRDAAIFHPSARLLDRVAVPDPKHRNRQNGLLDGDRVSLPYALGRLKAVQLLGASIGMPSGPLAIKRGAQQPENI
jgi:hypothetical protein